MTKTEYITDYIKDLEVSEGPVQASGEKPTIFKKILTGYTAIKIKLYNGSSWVKSIPVFQTDFGEDVEEFGLELQQNEEVIAVVPPAKLTWGVWALLPESSTTFEEFQTDSYNLDLPVFLGFEYDQCYHKNWIKMYKEKLMQMFRE